MAGCVFGCQANSARLIAEQRQILIDSIASALNCLYVFPDIAARMETDLYARVRSGEFDAVSDASSFAKLLTQDLQAMANQAAKPNTARQ